MNEPFCEVITVCNRIFNPFTGKISWLATTLENCAWISTVQQQQTGNIVKDIVSVTAIIPAKKYWGKYRPPNSLEGGYYALTQEYQPQFFTINLGDVIFKGALGFDPLQEEMKDLLTLKKGQAFVVKVYRDNSYLDYGKPIFPHLVRATAHYRAEDGLA